MFVSTSESVLSLLIFFRLVLVNNDSRLPPRLGRQSNQSAALSNPIVFFKG